MRRRLLVLLVLAVGCGRSVPSASDVAATGPLPTTTTSPSITTTATIPPTTAVGVGATTIAPPSLDDEPVWLVPAGTPPGLQLADARRDRMPNCGRGDCPATVATATLVYETVDPTAPRSLSIRQSPPVLLIDGDDLLTAAERVAGARRARVIEVGDQAAPGVRATWTEPGGIVVGVDATGIPWAELATVIAGMHPAGPGEWPAVVPHAPVGRCVDARSQLAPETPAGWRRFVIQAQPTGGCENGPFLFVSFVREPGPGQDHGTLITLVTMALPAASVPGPGEAVDVAGRPAVVERYSNGAEASARLTMVVDTVALDAHGNATAEELVALLSTLRPVDDDSWAELVATVGQG